MVSLLVDMGLFAEGLFLERKLRGDAEGFWYPNRLGKRRDESLEYAEGEYSPPGYWGPGGAAVQDDAVPLSGWDDLPVREGSQLEEENVPVSGESSPFILSPAEMHFQEGPQPAPSVLASNPEGKGHESIAYTIPGVHPVRQLGEQDSDIGETY
jgi:hypothetical protein